MQQRSFGGVRLALAAFLLAATACKQSTPEKSQSSAAALPDKIVIGATLPLTGSEARIGGFYKEGYDLAFEEANKAGGVLVAGKRIPVVLQLLDDTSTQATAVSLADRLISTRTASSTASWKRSPYARSTGSACASRGPSQPWPPSCS